MYHQIIAAAKTIHDVMLPFVILCHDPSNKITPWVVWRASAADGAPIRENGDYYFSEADARKRFEERTQRLNLPERAVCACKFCEVYHVNGTLAVERLRRALGV